jgi:hypothetical protein
MAYLRLLGSAVLEGDDGEVLTGPAARRHPLALLAVLSATPSGTLSRTKLAGLLWPTSDEKAARNRLNTCAYRVRNSLGENVLLSVGSGLRLDREDLPSDVAEFEAALEDEAWEEAVERYGGDFLDGFRLGGSAAFEKWVDEERGRLRRAYLDALETLAGRAGAREDPVSAARWWRQRANEDPPDSMLRDGRRAETQSIVTVIQSHADELEAGARDAEEEYADEMLEYTEDIMQTVESLDSSLDGLNDQQFSALWEGMEVDYGTHLNRSDMFTLKYEEEFSEPYRETFDELVKAFQLFAMGKEYFKTLYYTREVSKLSRVLLGISLPTIVFVASSTLAIEANLLPEFWVLGLPPLLTFVSFVFTVSLAPFAVLSAYMLRVATVSKRTAAAGPFTLL